MKFIFKILFLISAFFLVFVPIKEKAQSAAAFSDGDRYTYIVYGVDDAAENTDVILLLSYVPSKSELNVIQIPRDTYFRYERGATKINSLYQLEQLAGYSKKDSLRRVSSIITTALGVQIDGYIAFNTSAIVKGIDAIGGVTVYMPADYTFKDSKGGDVLTLTKGDNLLSGKQAEYFIRYRQGYALGDLDRQDAQKVFLNGLLKTLKGGVGLSKVVGAIRAINDDTVTDISLTDAAVLFFKHKESLSRLEASYVTMPGKAIIGSDGIWYYVLSKPACSKLISEYVDFGMPFDPSLQFSDNKNQAYSDIYYSENIEYKIYTDQDITNEVKLWKTTKTQDYPEQNHENSQWQ